MWRTRAGKNEEFVIHNLSKVYYLRFAVNGKGFVASATSGSGPCPKREFG